MLVKYATNMPTPAICPSSDTPRYAVGRNEKKPNAVATRGERQRHADAVRGVQQRASSRFVAIDAPRESLTPNWTPKSTPSPTNSTMKATEIMFSAPTIRRPSAAVIASPTNSVMNTASDHAARAQRKPQNHQHDDEVTDAVEHRAVLQRRELFVGERLRAGQTDASRRNACRGAATRPCRGSHPTRSRPAQRAVVHDRLHDDERARRVRRRALVDQRAPRESGRLAGQHAVERVRALRQQMAHVAELHLTELQRQQESSWSACRKAGQAGVVRQRVDERARLDELRGSRHDLVGRQEKQAVVFEERAAGRAARPRRIPSARPLSAAVSAFAAASANSGARASTTTSTVSPRSGKAWSIACSSADHCLSFSIRRLMSVLILKLCAT